MTLEEAIRINNEHEDNPIVIQYNEAVRTLVDYEPKKVTTIYRTHKGIDYYIEHPFVKIDWSKPAYLVHTGYDGYSSHGTYLCQGLCNRSMLDIQNQWDKHIARLEQ